MNKNNLFIMGLVVVVAIGAYVLFQKGSKGQNPVTQQQTPISSSASEPSPQPPTPSPTAVSTPKPTPTLKEFTIVAKQYTFEPSTITVNKGDRVRLHVKTVDVTHGISIPDFGVNAIIKIGHPQTVEFVASKAGTFPFACSEYCGAGHPYMKGILIVK